LDAGLDLDCEPDFWDVLFEDESDFGEDRDLDVEPAFDAELEPGDELDFDAELDLRDELDFGDELDF